MTELMKITVVDGREQDPQIGVQSEYEIKVGSLVIYGEPRTPEGLASYTGRVTAISDPDGDYDDNLERAVEYPPKVTVAFADGSTEDVSTCNVTRHTWASSYPDGPDEMIYQADDLILVTEVAS